MLTVSGKKDGFALVVVILVMLLASFLASHLIMKVRAELKITAKYRQRAIGRLLAEGGISLALFRLKDKPDLDFDELLDGSVFLQGYPYETVLPNGKIKYYAVAESGKINLNSTSFGLIEKFLEYHGLEVEEVRVVVDSLRDWRDNDNLYRLDGAEQEYYQELERPYIPRNGKIEDPAEFFLIRGTESLKGLFDPYEVFTVNSKGNQINISSLTPELLDFLTGGQKTLQEEYYEQLKLGNGRITKASLQGIIGGSYSSLQNYLTDRPTRSNLFSITAYGYEGDFSEATLLSEEKGEADELSEDEEPTTYYPGTKVRVMVDTTNKGNGIKYLSWKEQHI
ncbi:MAG: hypothetical protein ABFQ82_01305 [Thermodesulfobacteriota bacterium]